MKKKQVIIFVLVLVFVAGAVPVFAQYYPSYYQSSPRGRDWDDGFDVRELAIDFIELKGTQGQPYSLSNKNDPKRNYTLLSSQYKKGGSFKLQLGDVLKAEKGCYIFFSTTGGWNYKLNERSSIEVYEQVGSGNNASLKIMVRSGQVHYGKDIQASKMIDFSSYAVNEEKVKKYVADLKKDAKFKNDNGALVNEIVIRKTRKGQFISGISGLLPDQLALPGNASNTVIQWANQAEMAYAIACVYGHTPNTVTDFKTDLVFILAGEDTIRQVLNTDLRSSDITKAQKDSVEKVLGTYKMKAAVPPDVLERLTRYTLQRVVKRDNISLRTVVELIPVAGVLSGVALTAIDAVNFGNTADTYYRK